MTSGGAERETLAGVVNRQRMAIHQIVGVFLRQSVGQHVERLSAIACPRHHETRFHRHTALIFHAGDEPRCAGISWMYCHCETELRRADRGYLAPRMRAVGGMEDSIVV